MNNLLHLFFLLFIIKDTVSSESENIKKREPQFIFTSPKTVTSGQNETVCLSMHQITIPTTVLVDLKIKDKHHLTAHILNLDQECFDITVPKLRHHIKNAQPASLHLQIQVNGTTHTGHTQEPILIYPVRNVIFVETDKIMYKPYEKVKIRILVLNQNLKAPQRYIIPIIRILNPTGITITVWENIPTEFGLVQLEHQLSQDASMGSWKIELNEISKIFYVKPHILPRFKVILENPKNIYVNLNVTKFNICGKYSYGQLLSGIAMIRINFSKFNRQSINKAKVLQNGCASLEFTNEELHLHEQMNSDLLLIATITEQDTSRVEITKSKSYVASQPFTLEFFSETYFQSGLPYHGKLKATANLIPLHGEVIEICYNVAVNKIWNIIDIKQCSNFTFDRDNTIYFYILPLKDNVIQLRLYAKSLNQTIKQEWGGKSYSDNFSETINAYYTINRWYSPTNSFIYLEHTNKGQAKCKTSQQFTVYYTTGRLRPQTNVTFNYMIKSQSKILKIRSVTHVLRKQQKINYNELKNVVGNNHNYIKKEAFADKFILKFKIDHSIISKYQLIVYYMHQNNEIVATNLDVSINKCLLNKVETDWSKARYYPGEKATFTIKTQPHSLCAISAIDNSLTFLDNSEPLNIDSLLEPFLLEQKARFSNKLNCLPQGKNKNSAATQVHEWALRRKRSKQHYGMGFLDQYDAYEAFNNFGVSVISNMKLLTKPCLPEATQLIPDAFQSYNFPDTKASTNPNYYDVHGDNQENYIRSFFPDTWLWELVPIGESETKVIKDVPHSITNWITNTLCVSPILGIGLSQPVEITIFQPFFLEVLSPNSIKRDETLYLEVILFNYLNYSIPVQITLDVSENLEIPGYPDERSVSQCIFAHDKRMVIFRLKGAALGKGTINVLAEVDSSYPGECGPEIIINKRDVVIKEITIKPEGYPIDDIKSKFLCANDSTTSNNISWSLELTEDFIEDSEIVKIIINADLLGPAINNLDKLLLVPTGCGEQIMATLAPNLYILQYLKAIGKLTPALRQRAKRNLKIGYQRILDYIHKDGSFSAFGYHDPSGSMFLTAFVVKTLQQSKFYIYIDQNVIDNAVRWIVGNQLENGCFAAISHVFHDMGGSSIENSTAALTSYVLISLLESGVELSETVKKNAKYCIRGHFSPDKYTLAISTYALSLVGWESEASRCLHRLLQIATQEDNLLWWSTPGPASTNIEMTSYVLMSLIHQNTSENLVFANSVIRWLAMQRGPNGGFVTTQDTAVALSAITKYAMLIHTSDSNLQINISTENDEHEITINAKDRLKTKQHIINKLPNNVNISIKGKGCILIQAHMQYNSNHIPNSEAFKLAVEVNSVSNTHQCSIAMVSPCLSYTGPDLQSNMAILEVTMPSGYEPDRASLYQLIEAKNSKVKKFEENENQVILYFTELNNEPICVPFNINENSEVDGRIDATIKLYDYYNPELQVSTKYKVNKCQPNEIEPIPALPNHKSTIINANEKSINIIDNNESIEQLKNIMDNKKQNIGLNPNFVNLDVEISVPEGNEENVPIYITPKKL